MRNIARTLVPVSFFMCSDFGNAQWCANLMNNFFDDRFEQFIFIQLEIDIKGSKTEIAESSYKFCKNHFNFGESQMRQSGMHNCGEGRMMKVLVFQIHDHVIDSLTQTNNHWTVASPDIMSGASTKTASHF